MPDHNTKLVNLTCRLTGSNLGQVPKHSLAGKFQSDLLHPSFSQSWQTLAREYSSRWNFLTPEDKSALMLAMIIHPDTIGPLVKISCPVVLPADLLAKFGPSIYYTCRQFANMDRTLWRRLVKPTKPSKSIKLANIDRLPKFHYSADMTPRDLILYVTRSLLIQVKEQGQILDFEEANSDKFQQVKEQLAYELEKFKKQQASKIEAESIRDLKKNYKTWDFILADVMMEFRKSMDWLEYARQQIRKPTNLQFLKSVQSYLFGLAQVSQFTGLTLPAIQYTHARTCIEEIIAKLVSEIDFSADKLDLPAIVQTKVANQVFLTETNPTGLNQSTPKPVTGILAAMGAIGFSARQQQETEVTKQAEVATFVLDYVQTKRQTSTLDPNLSTLDKLKSVAKPKASQPLDFSQVKI